MEGVLHPVVVPPCVIEQTEQDRPLLLDSLCTLTRQAEHLYSRCGLYDSVLAQALPFAPISRKDEHRLLEGTRVVSSVCGDRLISRDGDEVPHHSPDRVGALFAQTRTALADVALTKRGEIGHGWNGRRR